MSHRILTSDLVRRRGDIQGWTSTFPMKSRELDVVVASVHEDIGDSAGTSSVGFAKRLRIPMWTSSGTPQGASLGDGRSPVGPGRAL